MLVYQQNSNILPRAREAVEGFLDGRILRFVVDDEEVLFCAGLGVGGLGGDVLFVGECMLAEGKRGS